MSKIKPNINDSVTKKYKLPTKEEFLSKFSPIQFKCEIKNGSRHWSHTESKEFQIILISGRIISLPNFFESFYDNMIIREEHHKRHRSFFDHITFDCNHGLIPRFKVEDEQITFWFYYNIIDNKWETHTLEDIFSYCSQHLLASDIIYLLEKDKQKEIRLQKLEAFVNNICQKNQIIDQLINTADEIYNHNLKIDDKK